MAEDQEPAQEPRSVRWEKMFEEAKDDPLRTRQLEAMKRVMEENHEVLERLAKS